MMAKSLILLEVSEKWDLLVGFIKKTPAESEVLSALLRVVYV